MTAEH